MGGVGEINIELCCLQADELLSAIAVVAPCLTSEQHAKGLKPEASAGKRSGGSGTVGWQVGKARSF